MNSSHKGCALITGAVGNIGSAVTRQLARDGFPIYMVDIDLQKIQAMASDIEREGGRACGGVHDVRRGEPMAQAVAAALAAYGRVDALVHVVGHSGEKRITPIADIDDENWDSLIEFNLRSAFVCNRAVVPEMVKQGYGRIVNFATAGAFGTTGPVSGTRLPYVAAKAGVIGMSKQLAKDLAPMGITVNVVSPGLVLGGKDTRIRKMWEGNMTQEQISNVMEMFPMKRPAEPEEMAAAVSFLVSPQASYVSGQNLHVDGATV